jgi:PHP family Zn ribbon phosphoesterase
LEIDENNLSYDEIYRIIKEKDKKKFLYTIEFFPEEGKYHVDGHADCKFSCAPEDNLEFCPTCGKKLILGVLHRVNELADRKNIDHDKFIGYKNLIPLQEIIADNFKVGKSSKRVLKMYYEMTDQKTEFEILIDLSEEEIENISNPEIARAVINVRLGKVDLVPGYDGIYGKISIKNDMLAPGQSKLI